MRQLFVVLTLLGFASPAFAQTATVPGKITMIRTGWYSDSFYVVLPTPTLNPNKCLTPDGYESDGTYPGHNTYYQAALAAYIASRPVTVIIDDKNCGSGGRPVITGINIE